MSDTRAILITSAPDVRALDPGQLFDSLSQSERLFAHFTALAAWSATRIVLRQVSPESPLIFDLILELQRVCDEECKGNWYTLSDNYQISHTDMGSFLNYAATFLSNIGNYFGKGDRKFVPDVTTRFFEQISQCSSTLGRLSRELGGAVADLQPCNLGFPSPVTQSMYYPGCSATSEEMVQLISDHVPFPENTRVQMLAEANYQVLRASIDVYKHPLTIPAPLSQAIFIVGGDHGSELQAVCHFLSIASRYVATETRHDVLSLLQKGFLTGDLEFYKQSQRLWVLDKSPPVETIFGFVEPYRDPFGLRAEFEGIVGVVDKIRTQKLSQLVQQADKYLARLPWVKQGFGKDRNGPFEKDSFGSPSFSSVHVLAYCSSLVFPGINLPNYNDIRQSDGCKSLMITNSMVMTSGPEHMSIHIDTSERIIFSQHYGHTYYLWVVFHELFGHGTGKLLEGDVARGYNFDTNPLPTNPLTDSCIDSWYGPDETYTGRFGSLATTVDECRAECVGAVLMCDMELLALFGYHEDTSVTGRQLKYNLYLQLGVAGLRALLNYNANANKWSSAYSRAHFAIFRCLLSADDFLTVKCDLMEKKISISIKEEKIETLGKPSIESLLLKLHIYRSTGDYNRCARYFENLTKPEGDFLLWQKVMMSQPLSNEVFVQANTFVDGENVVLRRYEPSAEGIIRSWADRMSNLMQEGVVPLL